MRLHLWGTDFRRGTAEMRAKLYFTRQEREQKLRELLTLGFSDLVYLNTCNRVEFYTTAPGYFSDTRKLWIEALSKFGMTEEDYYRGYQLEGKSALRHLMRVSCSLESLVIGEPQILGQLKEALSWTKERQMPLDPCLDRSFKLAFETAKRVRNETAIGEKPVSVATLGIKHLERMEIEFPISNAVVVGRSPINLVIVQWLLKNRPHCPILWVNRSLETLSGYSEAKQTSLMSLEDFLKSPPPFSHMFTATASSEPIFESGFFAGLSSGTLRPVIFDFAQPPDVSRPECDCEFVIIHLEDLNEEAQENALLRQSAVDEADKIIEICLRDYCLQRKRAPLLKDFNEVEPHFWSELELALRAIEKEVPPEVHPKVKKWAEKLVKKNLHSSREHLRLVLEKVTVPEEQAIEVI